MVVIGLLLALVFEPGAAGLSAGGGGSERDQVSQRLTVREWTVTLVRAVRGLAGGGADTHRPTAGLREDGADIPRTASAVSPSNLTVAESGPTVRLRVEVLDLPPPIGA